MSLHTPSEFIQERIVQSVQNDKRELLKYMIFNHVCCDKKETLIKTKLLSLITSEPSCFSIPLVVGAVLLTDKENQRILMTHTKKGWDVPCRISNSDADLEGVILSYLKQQFDISATSKGIFKLDYIEEEHIFEICFQMSCEFSEKALSKNSRLMTKGETEGLFLGHVEAVNQLFR